MDGKNVNAGENRVWRKSEKLFVWYDGVGGINTVMESEWEGARGGRSREMIPRSNPLDTRSVWLPTGSERQRERDGGRWRAHTERNQVGRKKTRWREERKGALPRKARWQKQTERERGREELDNPATPARFLAEGRRRKSAMLQCCSAWTKAGGKEGATERRRRRNPSKNSLKSGQRNRMEERRTRRNPWLLRLTWVYGPLPGRSYYKMLSKNERTRA